MFGTLVGLGAKGGRAIVTGSLSGVGAGRKGGTPRPLSVGWAAAELPIGGCAGKTAWGAAGAPCGKSSSGRLLRRLNTLCSFPALAVQRAYHEPVNTNNPMRVIC